MVNPAAAGMRFGRRGVLLAFWLGIIMAAIAAGQGRPANEYAIKAEFLYQFGRFVQWPAQDLATTGDAFEICVLGVDPFGTLLDDAIRENAVEAFRPVLRRIDGLKDADRCRILFISPSEESRLPDIFKAIAGRSVLTVGEGRQFTKRGGMIAFRTEQNHIRFSINVGAAERGGLRVSSQLLKLADVEPEGSGT